MPCALQHVKRHLSFDYLRTFLGTVGIFVIFKNRKCAHMFYLEIWSTQNKQGASKRKLEVPTINAQSLSKEAEQNSIKISCFGCQANELSRGP